MTITMAADAMRMFVVLIGLLDALLDEEEPDEELEESFC